jgi:3-oxoadipate enol-lactonase
MPTTIVASGAARLPVWIDGDGPPIVLLHAGVADHRMWDPLVTLLAPRHRVVRYDLRGFGAATPPAEEFSACDDLAAVLDAGGLKRAAIVGASYGGRVALQFAIEHPERVSALTLLAGALPEHEWSPHVHAAWAEEESAIEAGDLDAAAQANVRAWLVGPRRAPEQVDPALRALVADMARRALAHELAGGGKEREPDPPLGERLERVSAPTVVACGALDFGDFAAIADRLAAGIPDARRVTLDGAAHLPALERPDDVLRFLA